MHVLGIASSRGWLERGIQIGRVEARNFGGRQHRKHLQCHIKPTEDYSANSRESAEVCAALNKQEAGLVLSIEHGTSWNFCHEHCSRVIKWGRKKMGLLHQIWELQGDKRKSCVGCLGAPHLANSSTSFRYQSEHFFLRKASLHPD